MPENLRKVGDIQSTFDIPTDSNRGMPRWREKQRRLPIGEKISMIGQLIQETRQMEVIKKHAIRL